MFQSYLPQLDGASLCFTKEDVLSFLKQFLKYHHIPSEIVTDVNFEGYFCIYISLEKGSIEKYGEEMRTAFSSLESLKSSYSLLKNQDWSNDKIECSSTFIEKINKANFLYAEPQQRPSLR